MKMISMTPVLVVDAIEPCVPFWVDRLGFTKFNEVEHEGALGFAMFQRDKVTIMYQSRASVRDDLTSLSDEERATQGLLYVTCDDLEAIEGALEGLEPAVARRRTFYGAEEVGFRDPAGHVILFSQRDG